VWVGDEAVTVRDEKGTPLYLQGVMFDITERVRAEERARRLLDQQVAVNQLALALGETRDLDEIYHTICQHIQVLVDTWGFIVSSYDNETQLIRAEYLMYKGTVLDVAEFPPIPLTEPGQGGQSQVIHTGKPRYDPDHRKSRENGRPVYTVEEDGTIREGPPLEEEQEDSPSSALYVPMKIEGKTVGVMQLQSPRLDAYTREDIDLLTGMANVAAIAVQNARLYDAVQQELNERKWAEEELQHTLEKLREALGGIVQTVALTVEMRDPYTAGHQRRVGNLARAIANEMSLSEERIDGIRMAGLIHDLGKVGIPAEILSKPIGLSDLEYGLIQAHPQIGYDVLKEIEFPWPMAQIVLQHHERMDGSGYPQGLSGEEIVLEARILAIADVVEAMASFRPYRPALGIDKALEEISQNRGILYDPEAADACLKLFSEKGFEFEQDGEAENR